MEPDRWGKGGPHRCAMNAEPGGGVLYEGVSSPLRNVMNPFRRSLEGVAN